MSGERDALAAALARSREEGRQGAEALRLTAAALERGGAQYQGKASEARGLRIQARIHA